MYFVIQSKESLTSQRLEATDWKAPRVSAEDGLKKQQNIFKSGSKPKKRDTLEQLIEKLVCSLPSLQIAITR